MDASSAAALTLACPSCEAMSAACYGMPLLLIAFAVALVTPLRETGTVSWQHRCTGCGYDLRGLGERPRCPECGLDGAGRVVSRSTSRLAMSPVRAAFALMLFACIAPVTTVNFSAPVWELLYLAEWGRVPLQIRPASGAGSLVLAVILLPLLTRSLGAWRERGLWLAVVLSAAGFWLAQPIGVLADWQLNEIQPGGPGMHVAPAAGLLAGLAAARVITHRRAMLRLRRIRSSRSASQPEPESPASP